MAVISKYVCEVCQKLRTYKVQKAEHFDARRVVCKGCREKYPDIAQAKLAEWAKYGPVQYSI